MAAGSGAATAVACAAGALATLGFGFLLKDIKATGMTKVIIEHDMHVVFSLADRISVLAGGRIICQGTPDEVKADPRVKEAYLGEEQV